MKITRKFGLAALSISAMLLPVQALAMNNTNSSHIAIQPASYTSTVQHSPNLNSSAHVKPMATKRKIRVIREPLPQHSQATRTNTHGRFVIANDGSKDTMKVFKAVKSSTAMPNLFKN